MRVAPARGGFHAGGTARRTRFRPGTCRAARGRTGAGRIEGPRRSCASGGARADVPARREPALRGGVLRPAARGGRELRLHLRGEGAVSLPHRHQHRRRSTSTEMDRGEHHSMVRRKLPPHDRRKGATLGTVHSMQLCQQPCDVSRRPALAPLRLAPLLCPTPPPLPPHRGPRVATGRPPVPASGDDVAAGAPEPALLRTGPRSKTHESLPSGRGRRRTSESGAPVHVPPLRTLSLAKTACGIELRTGRREDRRRLAHAWS